MCIRDSFHTGFRTLDPSGSGIVVPSLFSLPGIVFSLPCWYPVSYTHLYGGRLLNLTVGLLTLPAAACECQKSTSVHHRSCLLYTSFHILSAAYLSLPTLPQNIISMLRSLCHKAVLKILSKVCAGYLLSLIQISLLLRMRHNRYMLHISLLC